MGSSGVEFYPPNLSQVETRLGVLEGTVLEENLYDNQEFLPVRIFPNRRMISTAKASSFSGI
jgi:hypothetical protein